MSNPWDDEFDPSAGTRNMLRWAHELGEEIELGIELVGPDAALTTLLS